MSVLTPKEMFEHGQIVTVKVGSEFVEAVYDHWSDRWDSPVVRYNGKNLYRHIYNESGQIISSTKGRNAAARAVQGRKIDIETTPVKPSRFNVNQRFQFIEELVDMVILGASRSLIITGSGGLGKTYTVMDRIGRTPLRDVDEMGHICDDVCAEMAEETGEPCQLRGDYHVVKGFVTAKSLYRVLFENKNGIVVFDDMDSVWENQTSLNLLKTALDSYETRRLSWFSEIRGENDLPRSFEFQGKIIFVSNLSLTELDQAVLSRALYCDVSMTPDEKIERIRTISSNIRPDLPEELKKDCLDLLDQHRNDIGDLNIRTFLKVLEVRASHPDPTCPSCGSTKVEYHDDDAGKRYTCQGLPENAKVQGYVYDPEKVPHVFTREAAFGDWREMSEYMITAL